jgi:hypothetical protein
MQLVGFGWESIITRGHFVEYHSVCCRNCCKTGNAIAFDLPPFFREPRDHVESMEVARPVSRMGQAAKGVLLTAT